jgi:hypothetical protein
MIDARAAGSGDGGGALFDIARGSGAAFDAVSHVASPRRKSTPKPVKPCAVVPLSAQLRSFS